MKTKPTIKAFKSSEPAVSPCGCGRPKLKAILIPWLLVLLSWTAASGDEQVRRVQEELRKRNLYFADIDGKKSKEVTAAIRRYQERKGFTPTGELDGETLRSLDLAPPEPVAEALPDVPVLKSDAARQMAESDRKLLEALEKTPLPPVGEAPAKSPANEVPPPPEPAGEVGPPSTPAAPGLPPPPVKPVPKDRPEATPSRSAPSKLPSADPGTALLPEQAESFVRAYLDTCETNQLEAELAFYADRVNYFDHGVVRRDFIAKDVARYYRRWPERNYELLDLQVGKPAGDEIDVKFRIAFSVRNPEHRAAGRTLNHFKIRRAGDELHFVSLKEQRIRP